MSKHNHCWAAPLLDDRGKEAIPMQALEHLNSLLIDDYRLNFPLQMHLEHLNSSETAREFLNLKSIPV